MATLAFAAAGAALGSSLLPAGLTVFGTTLTGAAIGSQVGALGGSFVDQALFGASGQSRAYEGPRLSELRVTASTEGSPIPRVLGRCRIGGQVIWAADIEEEVTTTEAGGSGKGGLAGSASATQTTYSYFASFAVGLCEGEVAGLGRIWADGEEVDQTSVVFRLYTGSELQMPDSLISAYEGPDDAPGFRGLAYVVFERLALASYGNRIPQLSFEVLRPLGALRERVRSVVVIPGSGEFVYATEPVTRGVALGERVPENVHTFAASTDWAASMDQLQVELPNVENVSLVSSWFGSDLSAGVCELRPGVELREKETVPLTWSVSGVTRASAHLVSEVDGRPAYGGTPSDESVLQAIRDLKDRGIAVTLTPFILMDIPSANERPDPYDPDAEQPAFPWRGRVTVSPAPGVAGSPDKTAAALAEIAAFVGTASPDDFTIAGETVSYSGPDEWSYRRFVLHHAALAKAAGGVDTFVIGSEMRGLTQVRSSASEYPFVEALVALAADVKSMLGAETHVTYAADWSEFFGHQPADGTGDVYFHLDPLWASSDIDAVGIDMYWPLADWRDGDGHADRAIGRSIYDLDYLTSNLAGGEGFDWYYASEADRAAQIRTPITDSADKPWVYRYKDLLGWWSQQHFDRPSGVEGASPTAWVPEGKPIWFMETGCPAIDKGANQPNVFHDAKSSESALPYFGEARRDDLIQRNYVRAVLEGFDPESSFGVAGLNPVSAVYGGPMLDLSRIYVYAWDARPFPAFPADSETWGDTANWAFGHWLNGRLSAVALDVAVGEILAQFDEGDHDASALDGLVPGYALDRIMSAREAIQPLELAYFFDSIESGARITFRHRGGVLPVADLGSNDAVEVRPGEALLTLTRGQETELPRSAKVRYIGSSGEYRQLSAESRRLVGASGRVSETSLPIMLEGGQAGQIAETLLHETWVARERAKFTLPPSWLALEPGDILSLTTGERSTLYRLTEIGNDGAREVEARAIDPSVYQVGRTVLRPDIAPGSPVVGSASAVFLDLPLLRGDEPENAGYVALTQTPWPGQMAVFRSPGSDGFRLATTIPAPVVIGTTLAPLQPGPEGRLDRGTLLTVQCASGSLQSVSDAALLDGANVAAVQGANGTWEVIQFQSAELVGDRTYVLSGLLRGQAGTEDAMAEVVPAGATFVLLDGAVGLVDLGPDQVGLPFNWRYGPARYDIGHASYAETTHAFQARGRKPLSPVHIRGTRHEGGLDITWVRRTRAGGDSWEIADVPLGETSESYEVDIMDGETVVRTLAALTPSVTYAAASQVADFGALPASVTCRVFQVSESMGRGTGRTATI